MSDRSADLDPDALSAFVSRMRAAKQADAPAKPRRKKASKLAERTKREERAWHYGDGRRRAKDQEALVQMNLKVTPAFKETVQTIAAKKRLCMVDVIELGVRLLEEHEAEEKEIS